MQSKIRFGEPPKPTHQRRVLPGISAETAAATSADVVADGTRYEWRIPVRATEARCAKIPAIVMVIRFRHVGS
jgi:predicted subunit of tRNA(5-methylaminomethyl-2-thiouridylate) methyltransferase